MLLKTERLLLRRFTPDDFEAFRAYAADPTLCRMIGWADLTNKNAAWEVFNGLLNEEGTCAIVDARLGRVIGNISFKPPHPHLAQDERLKPHRGGCLSFALSAQRRREGLAQEAAEAVMCHQFLTERVDYINCGFFSFNEPSRRLQEKLGFHFFSTHRFRLGKEEIEVIENILWREEYLALVSGNDGSKNFDERAVTP